MSVPKPAYIIQQNLNRGITTSPDLYLHIQNKLQDGYPVIAAIQEPQLNSGFITTFPDRNMIYCRTTKNATPRAALFISNGLYVSPMPAYMEGDMATGLWTTNDKRFKYVVVSSIYMDGKKAIPEKFQKLLNFCKRKRLPYICMADTNAHTPVWGELHTDPRGTIMEDKVMRNNIAILNRGRRPHTFTWKVNDSESIIDITFCSQDLVSQLQNWKAEWKAVCNSDHSTISMDFYADTIHYTYVRNYHGPGWSRFGSDMETKSKDKVPKQTNTGDPKQLPEVVWDQGMLEREAQSFTDDILTTLDITHPKKKIPITLPDLKWFDDNVAKAKGAKKLAHNKWRNSRTDQNYQNYKDSVTEYRKAIKKARRSSWRNIVDNIHDFKSVAKFNKILNRKSLNGLGQLIDDDGNPTATIDDSLNILLQAHFPQCSDTPIAEWEPDPTKSANINSVEVEYFKLEKLDLAIKSFGEHKAAGLDEVKPIVLQVLHEEGYARKRLLQLFKASIALSYIPKCWRESKVIFMPKPGKSDYSNPRSFRPLSLMSFILKCLERLVLYQLQETTFIANPHHINQHAFRKGRSCESALSNMVEYVEAALIKKQYATAVFLDVKGAFDNVLTEDMLSGLRKKETPSNLVNWYAFCLSHRKITLEHNGHKVTKFPTRGTPQGGVLSPVMWNVAFESLLDLFPDSGRVKIIGYADDAVIVCSGPNHEVIVQLLQKGIDKALEWGKQHGLIFEPTKTVAVTFTHKKVKLAELNPLYISGHKLKYELSAKYLGIHLDYRLEWNTHLTRRLNKAKVLLHKVREAAGKLWGLHPRMSIWFYRAIVRPMFTYGSIVWSKLVSSKDACTKMRRLQRMALMSMGNFYCSTPTAGLEVATFTTPLPIHVQQEAAMAYLRTKDLVKLERNSMYIFGSPKKTGHRQFIETFLMDIGFVDNTSDEIPQQFNWDAPYIIDTSSFEKGEPDQWGDVTIFTDGSKNKNGHLGAGFVEYRQRAGDSSPFEQSWYLGTEISVYQTELYAITKALEHVQAMMYSKTEIIIYTDCRAALQSLQSKIIKSRQIKYLVALLKLQCFNNKITLRWIKAHVGHCGNERADFLAKKGADSKGRRPNDVPHFSNAAIRAALREKVVEYWERIWQEEEPCRQTKLFFPKINKKQSTLFADCSRKVFTETVHMITGHNFFNRHQHLVNSGRGGENEVYPYCRYCDEDEETSFHLIAECPHFASLRRKIFESHVLEAPFTSKEFKPIKLFQYLEEAKFEVFELQNQLVEAAADSSTQAATTAPVQQ